MIVDTLGRRFRNLRISLTAACNYACSYCVPDGKRLQAARQELDADELLYATQLLIDAAGIDKVRITGGEPLLSPKFDALLPALMQLPLTDVSLTTNGQLLTRKAATILNSGVRRINVSLDTLDADGFRRIARSGDLATVLLGIEQMLAAGIKIKVNMVPMRRKNADQVLPMLEYCFARGIELRFIELMNMGHLRSGNQYVQDFYGMEEILESIGHAPSSSRAPTHRTTPRQCALKCRAKASSASSPTRASPSAVPARDCDCPRTAACTGAFPTPDSTISATCCGGRGTRQCRAFSGCLGWRWETSRT